LMDALGPARDADVFCEEILEPLGARLAEEQGWSALVDHFTTLRAERNKAAQDYVASAAFPRFLLRATAWIEDGIWAADPRRESLRAQPVLDHGNGVLAKRHKRLLKDGRGFKHLPDEPRHALRIRVKKVRYALDVLGPLYGEKTTKPLRKALSALQESLGGLNDIAVAGDTLRQAAEAAGPENHRLAFTAGHAAGLLEIPKTSLLRQSEADWRAFKSLRPPWLAPDPEPKTPKR
ncbi:MAG: CHAD domain-containing protein, partial [Rhodospirillaceae bacterium]